MQQKTKVVRAKARKMFNDKVRRLATWVKSHDPRPCGDVAAAGDGGGGEAPAAPVSSAAGGGKTSLSASRRATTPQNAARV